MFTRVDYTYILDSESHFCQTVLREARSGRLNGEGNKSNLHFTACNFSASTCAQNQRIALCCRSALDQIDPSYMVCRRLFSNLFHILPPGLASSFPLDRNLSKGASFSNIFSWSQPLKKLCQNIFTRLLHRPGPLSFTNKDSCKKDVHTRRTREYLHCNALHHTATHCNTQATRTVPHLSSQYILHNSDPLVTTE